MARLISLPTFTDPRGSLTVAEKLIPFDIKRVFYIHHLDKSARGGHRHKQSIQAIICVHGSCKVFTDNDKQQKEYSLSSPDQCLIVSPQDWRVMHSFSNEAVLLVLSSQPFDPNDYIRDPYR